MKIKSKIWIETEEGILIGEGRVQLLKMIDNTGSLSKAAKALDMSYQKAWRLMDSSNKHTKQALIITSIGGKKGGGTTLTTYGKQLVNTFESINKECWSFLDKELDKHVKSLKNNEI